MRTAIFALCCTFAPSTGLADGGRFLYYRVEPDGEIHAISPGAVDLTFPLPGTPTPVIDVSRGERNRGTPVSWEELRRQFVRGERAHVIIARERPPEPVASASVAGSSSTKNTGTAPTGSAQSRPGAYASKTGPGSSPLDAIRNCHIRCQEMYGVRTTRDVEMCVRACRQGD